MKKVGFDNQIMLFFMNYLVDRKMNYYWNNFMFPVFNIDVGVGQGSVLSPILSVLYFSPFIYILENHLKNLKISISIISFVDNVSGMVHTGVKVCRVDSEMSGLMEQPWLQLMYCAVCLPCGHNFR